MQGIRLRNVFRVARFLSDSLIKAPGDEISAGFLNMFHSHAQQQRYFLRSDSLPLVGVSLTA
ncbi:hypothetical protein J2125_002330 [Erwinia toletana]|uniref:Uncharacterized protein n=1 Tax=Winslowiella toletana TaxID=92490 RepID=A0ABS4PB14_9GAMM|nr:hypothetical protein [Winslowiella toletana]